MNEVAVKTGKPTSAAGVLDVIADAGASGRRLEIIGGGTKRSIGRVEGDARRLCEAVEKLLGNAIAQTPAKGRVLLHASGTTEGALIVVSDNGPGDEAGVSGTITSARESIKVHGGALSVMAKAGQGTLVRIDLPR